MSKKITKNQDDTKNDPRPNDPCRDPKNPDAKSGCCMVNVCCCDKSEPSEPEKELVFARPLIEKEYCCFEIYMTRCKILDNKEGPQDRFAELMIAGYANEKEAVFPGLGQYVKVGEKFGWVNCNKKIGTFKVEKGDTFPIYLRADVLEYDKEGAAGGADIGSNDDVKTITLNCGNIAVPKAKVEVECYRTGIQGGVTARVEIEFAAFRVVGTCC